MRAGITSSEYVKLFLCVCETENNFITRKTMSKYTCIHSLYVKCLYLKIVQEFASLSFTMKCVLSTSRFVRYSRFFFSLFQGPL